MYYSLEVTVDTLNRVHAGNLVYLHKILKFEHCFTEAYSYTPFLLLDQFTNMC